MKKYIFVLGKAFLLAKSELLEYFEANRIEFKPVFENDPIIILEFSSDIDTQKLIQTLGGLVKIAELINETNNLSVENIAKNIKYSQDQNLTLGISSYFDPRLKISDLLKNLKDFLKSQVKSFRYILPQNSSSLSTVVVKKQKISEYLIIHNEQTNNYYLGKTLAVQDFYAWNQRDYGRPYASPKSGMLPPKVARMMVNIAGFLAGEDKKTNTHKVLLDPFCGMGTILAEALMTGWNVVIGSDLKKEVILQTGTNLTWLKNKYPEIPGNFNLKVSDATHLDIKTIGKMVDAIVTEPFMGSLYEYINQKLMQKNKPVNKKVIENNIKGLEKLYIGALKNWYKILKPKGIIVIVLPEIEFENRKFSVKKTIDSCEKLGYTLLQGPYYYSRVQAIVRRKIYVFTKK